MKHGAQQAASAIPWAPGWCAQTFHGEVLHVPAYFELVAVCWSSILSCQRTVSYSSRASSRPCCRLQFSRYCLVVIGGHDVALGCDSSTIYKCLSHVGLVKRQLLIESDTEASDCRHWWNAGTWHSDCGNILDSVLSSSSCELYHFRLLRVELKAIYLQPLVDSCRTVLKFVNIDWYISFGHSDVNLSVVGILMMSDTERVDDSGAMYSENNSGPREDPCGMPVSSGRCRLS